VNIHEIFKDAKCIYLLMEICTGGDLFDCVMQKSQNVQFSEHKAATYCEQILSAITYLHSQNIAHRDIRPDNILLQAPEPRAETKLIDFGLACRCADGEEMTLQAGSASYMAPEIQEGGYDLKCDLWSCGVLFYIMLCGSPPFDGSDDREIMSAARSGKVKFPSALWGQVSQCAKDFVASLLTRDPSDRPHADQLIKHDWLKRGDVKGKQPLPSVVARLKTFTLSRKLKKVCLTMIATQLPRNEIEDLRLYFKSLDKNGDGTISNKELRQGLEMQAKANKFDKLADLEWLMSIDTDGSGSVDYTEFIAAAIDKRIYQRRDVIWSAFRAFDLDGNGSIDKQELKMVMDASAAGAVALPEEKIKALIKDADKDGDGKIDFEEFMAMMTEER
jgi:calcium-dependent protein kinase